MHKNFELCFDTIFPMFGSSHSFIIQRHYDASRFSLPLKVPQMNLLRISLAFTLAALLLSCADSDDEPKTNEGTSNNMAMPDVGNGQGPDCVNDDACGLGRTCTEGGDCTSTSCDNCTGFQICYVTNENPEGTCSAGIADYPTSGESCESDMDCDLGAVCSASKVCVVLGCPLCTEDQICFTGSDLPDGSCSAPECMQEGDCPQGESCSGGMCD